MPEITPDTIPDIPSSAPDRATATPAAQSDAHIHLEKITKAFWRATEENARLKQEMEKIKKQARTTEILDQLMVPSATKAFRYMFAYSGAVGIILLMNSFGIFPNPLAPEVLKFLVGSTAATVLGLVGMVLAGIFIGARR